VREEKVYFCFRAEEIYPISEHNTKQKTYFLVFVVERSRVGDGMSGMQKYLRQSQRYENFVNLQMLSRKLNNHIKLSQVIKNAPKGQQQSAQGIALG